jgi:hypothetical protein
VNISTELSNIRVTIDASPVELESALSELDGAIVQMTTAGLKVDFLGELYNTIAKVMG